MAKTLEFVILELKKLAFNITTDRVLSLIFFIGIAYLGHRYWRFQAIFCASQWLLERGLIVSNWATADFCMHRQNPSIAFLATDHRKKMFDIKLRFKFGLLGDWKIDEVAYWCESPRTL